jgi:hypothetical protein
MNDEVTHLAARATLVAYQEVMRARLTSNRPLFEVAGLTAALAPQEAVHALVELPKPLRCIATARESCIVLTCTPLSPEDVRQWHDWVSLGIAGDVQRLTAEYGAGAHEPVFMVGGGADPLRLPARALAYWTRSYDLADISRFITHAPTTLRAEQVDGVIEFDGAISVHSGLL